EGLLIDQTLGEQHLTEWTPLEPLRGQRALQLLGGQQPMLEKQLAKTLLRAGREPAFGLTLDGAQVTSWGNPCSRRWIA
ncbi:MAG TPA: hypothetical protein VN913_06055, partial [Candidatus Binatus sp.]|nr:hypothetical protein [Candidatus Binatus sp.]